MVQDLQAVGMADSIHSDDYQMQLASFSAATVSKLDGILRDKGLAKLVSVSNPFDINPSADDEAHAEIVRILGEDGAVDAIVVGLDPLSPAMHTLAETDIPAFSLDAETGIVPLLSEVATRSTIPIVGVVEWWQNVQSIQGSSAGKWVYLFFRYVTGLWLLYHFI